LTIIYVYDNAAAVCLIYNMPGQYYRQRRCDSRCNKKRFVPTWL